MREGAWVAKVPTITGPISADKPFLIHDYRVAQQATKNPIKITIPGPMTIMDSLADSYYHNEKILGEALAQAINLEVRRLVAVGCKWIQIDEPLFARYPEKALRFGINNLNKCIANIPQGVFTAVHICCGYPEYLDQKEYWKAKPQSYFKLAKALDNCSINAISIEDTHRPNDPKLFSLFKRKTIILGVIDVTRSHVESIDEFKNHILKVAKFIDPKRLMIAPDCGLGMLPRDTLKSKVKNMVQAVKEINFE